MFVTCSEISKKHCILQFHAKKYSTRGFFYVCVWYVHGTLLARDDPSPPCNNNTLVSIAPIAYSTSDSMSRRSIRIVSKCFINAINLMACWKRGNLRQDWPCIVIKQWSVGAEEVKQARSSVGHWRHAPKVADTKPALPSTVTAYQYAVDGTHEVR